jgi:hypothetical protein
MGGGDPHPAGTHLALRAAGLRDGGGPAGGETGFSAAAASLVPLIDQSVIFSEASLAGPISVDQAENRERFVIQATVGKTAKPRTAAR